MAHLDMPPADMLHPDMAHAEEKTLRELRAYRPINEQEERDKYEMLWLLSHEDCWSRENSRMHVTASAWVCDEAAEHVLMCWHNIYRSWSWLGGHADGERDLLAVAMREVREESGLVHVQPAQTEPISLEILSVDGHMKHGHYVSTHVHLNVTYLLLADPGERLVVRRDENSALAWFSPAEAVQKSSEPWLRDHIYQKENDAMFAWARAHAKN
ncbi:MAG: NUDIX hydrolase [Atopobiaceae bacterium]|jgi:8-oxo-dGTP pyrophosphatase MutT (NUDIX family)